MLTAQYDMEPLLNSYHLGLTTIFDELNDRVMLIVKAPKEMILAAKINGGFDIFIVPPDNKKIHIATLCSAFPEAPGSPIVIVTPMFNSNLSLGILKLLKSKKFTVHFFDENNRELLGYECQHEYSKYGKDALETLTLVERDLSLLNFTINDIDPEKIQKNGINNFIAIKFGKPTMPDDFVRIDTMFSSNNYHGALNSEVGLGGVGVSRLIVDEPGAYQERDIALILERVFHGGEIYLNPHNDKLKEREEITDVMVAYGDSVLLIQAKDSPNTQKIINNKLERKINTSKKHFDKATAQMQGAIKYFNNGGVTHFYIGEKRHSLNTDGKSFFGLIVLKEIFIEHRKAFSSKVLMLSDITDVPCLFIEYGDLHSITFNSIKQPGFFFDIIRGMHKHGVDTGLIPKPRFLNN
ncbi:hypothetical protein HF405_002035 [Salmonella enterica]|nr:hypothetical protein [Salmonella enterica]EEY5059127.1 hypothetical protein [Salmonella enterica]